MSYVPMIDTDTGEIDTLLLNERANLRAAREYGGPNPPPNYVRGAIVWCAERASAERLQWRQQRGLPEESPCTLVDTAGWTDSFRRMA